MSKSKPSPQACARPILIGLKGTGKRGISRRLAMHLDMPLIELDEYIVNKAGISIPEFVASHSEDEFRHMEGEALREVVERRAVISTGGGIILSEENRNILRVNGPVIWLKASAEHLVRRQFDEDEIDTPAAQRALKKFTELTEARDPLYAECADLTLPRDCMKKDEVMRVTLRFLEQWKPHG